MSRDGVSVRSAGTVGRCVFGFIDAPHPPCRVDTPRYRSKVLTRTARNAGLSLMDPSGVDEGRNSHVLSETADFAIDL
jgi:hypothetical protein